MKATIIGSDFLQKNGSVKFLEINTNTTIYNKGAEFLDYSPLFNMLNANGITEFHFIFTEGDSWKPLNEPFKFKEILQAKCEENSITYVQYAVPLNSVTVPFIEDAPNRFILRQSFDVTALVDETYCSDKFGFFDLMKNSEYVPKTKLVSDELNTNTLDSVDYTDTENPNILVKYRYPQYDTFKYPALFRVSDSSELTSIIDSVETDYLVQEFIYSEDNLIEDRYSIIRSIDIIYGSNLDVINMGGYTQSSIMPISFTPTEYVEGTNKLNQKSRYKYITKEIGQRLDDYHTDDDSNILRYDGTLADVDTIQLGDYIRSINFVDFNENESKEFTENYHTYGWYSTLQRSNDTLTSMQSELIGMVSTSVEALMIQVTLADGKTWVEAPGSTFYIVEKDSTQTRFESVNNFYIGDRIVVTDANTSELTSIEVTGLEMVFEYNTIYSLDFAPSDLFLVDIGDGLFSVMHNGCWSCGSSFCGAFGCALWCPVCDTPVKF